MNDLNGCNNWGWEVLDYLLDLHLSENAQDHFWYWSGLGSTVSMIDLPLIWNKKHPNNRYPEFTKEKSDLEDVLKFFEFAIKQYKEKHVRTVNLMKNTQAQEKD